MCDNGWLKHHKPQNLWRLHLRLLNEKTQALHATLQISRCTSHFNQHGIDHTLIPQHLNRHDASNKNNRPLAIVGFLRLPGMAIHEAACHGDLSEVKRLLEGRGRLDTVEDLIKPLCDAVRFGHRDVVELLLEEKAPFEGCPDWPAPLCLAAQEGHKDVVQLLLQVKARMEARDYRYHGSYDKPTPLCLAVIYRHRDVAQLLLKEKADIFAVDDRKQTPLSMAEMMGESELVEAFLDHVAKRGACSCSQICTIIELQNQEVVVKALDRWPQETKMILWEMQDGAKGIESLRRAQLPERVRTVLAQPNVPTPEVAPDVELSKPLRSREPLSVKEPPLIESPSGLRWLGDQNLFSGARQVASSCFMTFESPENGRE